MPNHDERLQHLKEQKAKILNSYRNAPKYGKEATVLTKAEFEEQYPTSEWEIYGLETVDKFRQDIMKADDIEDKIGAFKQATENLKPFVIHGEGKQIIVFARKKEKGE